MATVMWMIASLPGPQHPSLIGSLFATAIAALGRDTSKRGVAAFLAGNGGADYRALRALTWFYNWGDNVRELCVQGPFRRRKASGMQYCKQRRYSPMALLDYYSIRLWV